MAGRCSRLRDAVWPPLGERDAAAVELMDAPDADPEALARTYARFGLVNAFVSGWRTVYRREIRPRLRSGPAGPDGRAPLRLLDIGTGGGDLPRALARWARADAARPLAIVAIDPDERAIAWARAHPASGIDYRPATSRELADAGERFDLVVSNHVLHHLSAASLGALLADSERLVRPGGVVVHADIARSRWGYLGFAAATAPFQPTLLRGSFIRPDGLTSIRRSFTPAELAAVLPAGWRVRRGFPSRLEAVRDA